MIRIDSLKVLINQHKKILLFSSSLILILLVLLIIRISFKKTIINTLPLSSYSTFKQDDGRIYFTLNSGSGSLFKSKKSGKEAVEDFIKSEPKYSKDSNLLPKNFSDNSNLVRNTVSEKTSENREHFFFEQTIGNIPIFGSSLIIHLKNGNEVYSLNGNLASDTKVTKQVLTQERAIQIAENEAKKETTVSLSGRDPKLYYFNKKLLDLSQDSTNHIALGVYIDSVDKPLKYSTFYLIDLMNGEVLYKENQFKDLLNRTIYDCHNTAGNCTFVKQEGDAPTTNIDAEKVYNIFQDVYDFYKQSFSRDSYDGNGGPYNGSINYNFGQANAAWDGQEMKFSPGLVVPDVTWHELTHALTQYTAGLQYRKQSGATNEAISDIFGSDADNNWTMGEGISPNAGLPIPLRSLSNPGQGSPPQPDRLFSPIYYCNGLPNSCVGGVGGNDNCGVHINSGIINKTFYLMTDGGSFNGCSMQGIGREKSSAIMYSTLTNYLTPTSNFYDVYTSILQACGDLYGATSSICAEVKKAAQATEIDQQTPGDQSGPVCEGIDGKPATCVGAPSTSPIPEDTPTNTPTPQPGATNTPTPTLRPGEIPTNTPTPNPVIDPTPSGGVFKPIGTATPTPDQYYTCVPDPACTKTGKSIQLCPLKCSPKQ